MSEKITKDVTVCVDLKQFTRAVMATCAMLEAAIENYGDMSIKFNDGLTALANEMKVHADYIHDVAIEPSKTISLTTKVSVKSEIDKLGALLEAYEQLQKKQSGDKKEAGDEEREA